MSSDRLSADMDVLMVFLSREDGYFVRRKEGLLLVNVSLTASEKVALLSRKYSFGSICSINRNKEGRKEGKREESDVVDVSSSALPLIECISFPS